jgi:hypothetical protein
MSFFLKTPDRLRKMDLLYRSFFWNGVWTGLYAFDIGIH